MACDCAVLGPGAQLFRIRDPQAWFEPLLDLGPLPEAMLGGRWLWRCRGCGALFALLRIPYKDEEDILVRVPDGRIVPADWDWSRLVEVASDCRWRGEYVDERHLP